MIVSAIITNIITVFVITVLGIDCDHHMWIVFSNVYKVKFKGFDKYFHLGRFPPVVQALFEGKYSSVLERMDVLVWPPATIKACLKKDC